MTSTADRVALLRKLLADPEMEVAAIAERFGIPPATIYHARYRLGLGLGLARRTQQSGAESRIRRAPGRFPTLATTDAAGQPDGPLLAALDAPCTAPGCRWPMWAWAERPRLDRFCDAPAAPGRAYCPEHAALATRRHGEPYRKRPTFLAAVLWAA